MHSIFLQGRQCSGISKVTIIEGQRSIFAMGIEATQDFGRRDEPISVLHEMVNNLVELRYCDFLLWVSALPFPFPRIRENPVEKKIHQAALPLPTIHQRISEFLVGPANGIPE